VFRVYSILIGLQMCWKFCPSIPLIYKFVFLLKKKKSPIFVRMKILPPEIQIINTNKKYNFFIPLLKLMHSDSMYYNMNLIFLKIG